MVCVAVLAVLATVAVPSMQGVLARRQLEGLSAQFVADLQFARSAAVARAETLRLRVQQLDTGSCYLVHTGPANACTCTPEPAVACSGTAWVLRAVHLSAADRLGVRANVGSMLIDPRQGTVSPTGSIDITASDGTSLRHVVNILGRVRLCTTGAKVGDVAAC
jgi:type IV fimbrial biogenesis protein FimT